MTGAGDVVRHYKGGLYRVICRSRDANDGTPCIIYQDIGTGRIYHRTEAEFTEVVMVVTGAGSRRMPRFQREGCAT